MATRSKVALYEQIRRAHAPEGLSVRALARRFGVHRRDVRLALALPVPPARKVPERVAPALEPWKVLIGGWRPRMRRRVASSGARPVVCGNACRRARRHGPRVHVGRYVAEAAVAAR